MRCKRCGSDLIVGITGYVVCDTCEVVYDYSVT